jgi:UDP-2-acetamido-2-deoxy-ribo-hexuluronate aminotransferase
METIQMVDLKGQYLRIKPQVDEGIMEVLMETSYINGPQVSLFKNNLEKYLNVKRVVPCANGTDALQIAMMALDLKPGDEVIVPAFTYVATAEVIALLNLKPIMVDVDIDSFNVTPEIIEEAITEKTRAVVPVNLYGQCADLECIRNLCDKRGLYMIEDNAQAIGADYMLRSGEKVKSGTVGHIGSTSFYPSKNLGAYGDGGALYTQDENLGSMLHKIANHGQTKRYYHDMVGVNSRLDSIQAAILNVKLNYLDQFASERRAVADAYDSGFSAIEALQIPFRVEFSSHVFHQYTLKVKDGRRDQLQSYLKEKGIPSIIYYPLPLYDQEAFKKDSNVQFLPATDKLCKSVLSLPIHTEMSEEQIAYIVNSVVQFFK